MDYQNTFAELGKHINRRIVGQEHLIKQMLIAILSDGHLLVEGPPGLAKTTAIKTLAQAIDANFHRIQFTPDLLPADLTGTDIYKIEESRFEFQKGPIFHNLILADEINRSPAKVQSALLEAMEEKQITVGHSSYELPKLFLVMATQNPIEQEGTYPLPEAQLDRFLFHVEIDYPNIKHEREILNIARNETWGDSKKYLTDNLLSQENLFNTRAEIGKIFMNEDVEEYLLQLINATRNPKLYSENLAEYIEYAVSPRATIALEKTSKAHAFLSNRDYVTPEDLRSVIFDVFRHRLILSFKAETKGITKNQAIEELLNSVPSP